MNLIIKKKKRFFMYQISKFIVLVGAIALLLAITACTDGDGKTNAQSAKPKPPWVMELQVIPSRLTINPDKFYAKPFTVRAKYSNAVVKNVSKTVQWVSENTNLLDINNSGELIVTGNCKTDKCPVFLVGTDPASGKSVRVTVHVKKSTKLAVSQKAEQGEFEPAADFKKKA